MENQTEDTSGTQSQDTNAGSQGHADVQALMAKIAELEKRLGSGPPKEVDLNQRVKQEREDRERKSSDTKTLEAAWSFNHTSADFLKQNESLLPSEISDIFSAAEKEKYESPIHKANATKSAIVQSFFSQQDNVDLLTDSQKSFLADYLKLTKNGKEDKAHEMYINLFEPALSTLKKVKKAEALAREKMGYRDGKGDSQYKDKLIKGSKHHYFGEKR